MAYSKKPLKGNVLLYLPYRHNTHNTYYYYDEYTANYRAFDLNKYTLYAEDATADTAGPGMNLYIDLSECLTDNIFTLPYEAWKSNSMILTFNVQVEYDGVIYKSQIRILEITAKPNLA